MTIEQRVRNGATFLDANVVGWEDKINVDDLNVGSCMRCILGQLFAGFRSGAIALDLRDDEAAALGFQVTEYEKDNDIHTPFRELTTAWRELLLERRRESADCRETVSTR